MNQKNRKARIGLLLTGHRIYWGQFPNLKAMGDAMSKKLKEHVDSLGEICATDLVDTHEKAIEAANFLDQSEIDLLVIFPLGYTTGMMIAPAVKKLEVPIIILNMHEDSSYDYKTSDTATYLHHEGPCCIPEYAVTIASFNKEFKVVSGHFSQKHIWEELAATAQGACAATEFSKMNFGVLGNSYTNMTDMPIDEHRVLVSTGNLVVRPEIEELVEEYNKVTPEELDAMYNEFRETYDVDSSVTNQHMKDSAMIAVAFEKVIKRHDINAFGYYWWGKDPLVTLLRSESALAVTRLTSMGIPGVTEGDIKTAMAMKILNMLGGGGMFLEYFSLDYDENFIMVGHDGPSNIDIAQGKAELKYLDVHHGKTGEGLGIDFKIKEGVCTVLSLSQFRTDKTFKLVYSIGKIGEGDILNIGNPNCRIKVDRPIDEFFDMWCQEAPPHHMALGIGDFSKQIEVFAQKMDFECVRI